MTLKQSKTPYEIRLEILQLAHQIVAERHRVRNHQVDAISGKPINLSMTSPTVEEITTEAEKLNAFVSKQNG